MTIIGVNDRGAGSYTLFYRTDNGTKGFALVQNKANMAALAAAVPAMTAKEYELLPHVVSNHLEAENKLLREQVDQYKWGLKHLEESITARLQSKQAPIASDDPRMWAEPTYIRKNNIT